MISRLKILIELSLCKSNSWKSCSTVFSLAFGLTRGASYGMIEGGKNEAKGLVDVSPDLRSDNIN